MVPGLRGRVTDGYHNRFAAVRAFDHRQRTLALPGECHHADTAACGFLQPEEFFPVRVASVFQADGRREGPSSREIQGPSR